MARLVSGLELEPGASEDSLKQAQLELGLTFPADYAEFMSEFNGAEGWVGESYLQLWPLEDMVFSNKQLKVAEYVPGLALFGGDGGGMAYGFDTRSGTYVEVDYVCIGLEEDTIVHGQTFIELLAACRRESH